MYQLADTDKAFIYGLNKRGYNEWHAHVTADRDDSDERTSKETCERIARRMAAAPDLLEAL